MQHFGYKNEPEKKKIKCNENLHGKNTHEKKMGTDLEKQMKTKLVELILNKLKSFAVPHHLIDMFNESFVTVETRENTIEKGDRMYCLLCRKWPAEESQATQCTLSK